MHNHNSTYYYYFNKIKTQYNSIINYITVFSLKNSSPTVAKKICHLVAVRIGMNKMAKGDTYLDYLDETLERAVKLWSALLGAYLETKWRVLNSPYGQQFEAITLTKTPGR